MMVNLIYVKLRAMSDYNINMIVAMDSNGGIGINGALPWNIPEDLRRFSKITRGAGNNMVIMGRKTWESIPNQKRPLKDRINVVLSSNAEKYSNTVEHDKNIPYFASNRDHVETLIKVFNPDNIYVIGGSTIYEQYASLAKCVYVTLVQGDYSCDTFFPSSIEPHHRTDLMVFDTYRFEKWYINTKESISGMEEENQHNGRND